jgi:hypothetical protein
MPRFNCASGKTFVSPEPPIAAAAVGGKDIVAALAAAVELTACACALGTHAIASTAAIRLNINHRVFCLLITSTRLELAPPQHQRGAPVVLLQRKAKIGSYSLDVSGGQDVPEHSGLAGPSRWKGVVVLANADPAQREMSEVWRAFSQTKSKSLR